MATKQRKPVETEIEPCKVCGAPGKCSYFLNNEKHSFCSEHFMAAYTFVYDERKAELAKWHQANIDRGLAYWAERGIAVGDKLQACAVDMLTGGLLGSAHYIGVAKVSKRIGAYVHCDTYPGMLDADYWRPLAQSVTSVTLDEELILANRDF